jgi:hypothetical protein
VEKNLLTWLKNKKGLDPYRAPESGDFMSISSLERTATAGLI